MCVCVCADRRDGVSLFLLVLLVLSFFVDFFVFCDDGLSRKRDV